MPIIGDKDRFVLDHDPKRKIIILQEKVSSTPLMKAPFFYDPTDGTTLLSDLQSESKESTETGLARTMGKIVIQFLSSGLGKNRSLICEAGDYMPEFREMKSNLEGRLMLRRRSPSAAPMAPSVQTNIPVTIYTIDEDAKIPSDEIISGITSLLRQHAYWAKEISEDYVRSAFKYSTCLFVKYGQEIIGFVRFTSNGRMAYVADMVVNENYRRRKIGTALTQHVCYEIDKRGHTLAVLMCADQGDGLAGAPTIYSSVGFVDYSNVQQKTFYYLCGVGTDPEPVAKEKASTEAQKLAKYSAVFTPPTTAASSSSSSSANKTPSTTPVVNVAPAAASSSSNSNPVLRARPF